MCVCVCVCVCVLCVCFREGRGCVLRRLHLVSFSIWKMEKSCGDGKMKNGYRFRALPVSIHGHAYRCFRILVAVLST